MDLKSQEVGTDPVTNFWAAYEKVADWHDPNLFLKCVEDLDTSLLFVSMFMSHYVFLASTEP